MIENKQTMKNLFIVNCNGKPDNFKTDVKVFVLQLFSSKVSLSAIRAYFFLFIELYVCHETVP